MRRRLVAAVWFSIGWLASATTAQELARLVAAAEALGARTGVAVCDDDGQPLFRHRVREAFAPASNMKLLTAAAVLSGLGADFEFHTTFALRAGRLVVLASGDPNWIHGTADDPVLVFAAVGKALVARGVTALRGIDLEAGTFTGPTRPPTWPQDQLHTYYCAPTGPFVLEQGVFVLRLAAADGGVAVDLVAPNAGSLVRVQDQVRLQDSRKDAVYGALDVGDGSVRATGRFWRKSPPVEIRTAMAEPTMWFRATLTNALAEAGVRIGADAVAVPDAIVHVHKSALAPALERMLEDSSNFDAEQCLRVLGAKRGAGSLSGGLTALEAAVVDLVGQRPDDLELVDGSGLSKQNRLSPAVLLTALFRASRRDGGAALAACLPVAGKSGTLAERFAGSDLIGRVRAKTGWIRGASALTGLVDGKDGRRRWFAILMNYDPKVDGLNKDLKRLQEQMVAVIDGMVADR